MLNRKYFDVESLNPEMLVIQNVKEISTDIQVNETKYTFFNTSRNINNFNLKHFQMCINQ